MSTNVIGLLASYIYATCLLLLGEGMRKFFNIDANLTRKFIHIGAGMWIFAVLILFDNWQLGIIPFASFIVINYFIYRYRLIGAVDSENSSPGTVYFAISVTLLFGLLWRPDEVDNNVVVAVAGLMSMTWGDACAALVGQRFGKHKYQIGQAVRSWEGSAAMFLVSIVAIFLVLVLVPGSLFSPTSTSYNISLSVYATLASASLATLAEAVSPQGTDNLSVPLVAAGVVWAVLHI